jgi:fatty-acyl-CoA synthase
VEPSTLAHATAALGPERLPMSAIVPAYGLAEAVLAVTMARVGDGPSFTTVDVDALAAGELVLQDGERGGVQPGTATLTSAGQPLPGNAVAVVGESPVGEIRVSSPSMATGYLGEPEATRRRFTHDGLMTGDIGFVVDGELFVAGRTDDLMPFAGRNVYARDVEVALSEVAGVRPGNCAVVDVANGSGTRLIAVVEPRTEDPDFGRVARRLARSARAGAGVKIDECVFVRRGGLPKTPSGKVQRFRCREIARAGADSVLTRIAL